MSTLASISLVLAGVTIAILGIGRLLRLELPRRLRVPLALVALTSLAQWVVDMFEVGGDWPELVTAGVLLSLGFLLARAGLLLVFDWLLVHRVGVQIPRLAQDIVALLVYLIVTAAVLKATLSLDVGTLLVSSAVITVVVGFALQETLGTLLSGLALAWERRLERGAWVEVDGTLGKVEELGWRSLMLRTRLGEHIIIPNSDVARKTIKLLGPSPDPMAVPVRLGVSYRVPPHEVHEVLLRVAGGVPGVLPQPAPQILTVEFADSAVVYECRLWTQAPWRVPEMTSHMLTRAWSALGRAGMEIPFPQRTVHMAPPSPEVDTKELCRAAIANCDLFNGLPEAAIESLSGSSRFLKFAPGESVIREGDESTALYVVASGSVTFLKGDRTVGKADTGSAFGELAFLMGQPRAATVQAASALAVVEIDAAALRALLKDHDEVADELASRVAARRKAMAEAMDTEATVRVRRSFAAEMKARLLRLVSG